MNARFAERHLPGVLSCREAVADPAPVVLDSPHSGRVYPPDFGHALPLAHLRAAEDLFVDDLFGAAPGFGAALLWAHFPRSYIDVNRRPADLDAAVLDGPWPEPLRPSEKGRQGKGLIRTRNFGEPVYRRRLSVAEVQGRLAGYYEPYHAALAELIAARRARFGRVWHLNCHSWTAPLLNRRTGQRIHHIDMCLGDRHGTTAGAAFTAFVAATLRGMGYVVRVNRPFRGMELVRRHGRPAEGQHSLQLEINRRLYMDHRHYVKLPSYAHLQADLTRLTAAICAYGRAQVGLPPAAASQAAGAAPEPMPGAAD